MPPTIPKPKNRIMEGLRQAFQGLQRPTDENVPKATILGGLGGAGEAVVDMLDDPNGQIMDSSNPMMTAGKVPATVLQKPVSDIAYGAVRGIKGLYSRLTDAMAQLPAKVHPIKALSQAKNMASAEELSYRGLDEFLKSKGNEMVPKDEILGHLQENPINLEVKKFGGEFRKATPDEYSQEFMRQYGRWPTDDEMTDTTFTNVVNSRLNPDRNSPKFAGYQTPGQAKN